MSLFATWVRSAWAAQRPGKPIREENSPDNPFPTFDAALASLGGQPGRAFVSDSVFTKEFRDFLYGDRAEEERSMMEWSAKIVCAQCGKKAEVEIVGERDFNYTSFAGEENIKGIVVGVEYMRPVTWMNLEYCSMRCMLLARRAMMVEALAGVEAELAAEDA